MLKPGDLVSGDASAYFVNLHRDPFWDGDRTVVGILRASDVGLVVAEAQRYVLVLANDTLGWVHLTWLERCHDS